MTSGGIATLEDAIGRDRSDPFADLRNEFQLPEGVIYLDGNSLARRQMPRSAE